MRALWLALVAALLLTGCGNDNNGTASTFNTGNTTATNGLAIDQASAARFAQVLSGVTITTGALAESQSTPANVLANLDGGQPVNLMTTIMAQLPALVQGGSRTINGSRGGTVTVTVDSAGTNLVFVNFANANTTITGNVNLVGRQTPTGGQVNAVFNQFRVTATGKAYQLDGPAQLAREGNTVILSTTVAVADVNGGVARFQNFAGVITFTQNGSQVSGTFAANGALEFQDFRGLTGTVQIANQQPFAFTADLAVAGGAPTVSAGQSTYTGNGALRLTVVAPNQLEVAVQPPGAAGFTPVQTVNFSQLLQ